MNGDFPTESTGDITAGADEQDEPDLGRLRRKSEANQHVANYVNDQLNRVRSNEPVAVFEDEFEAQLDDN